MSPNTAALPVHVYVGDPDCVAALLATHGAIRTGHFELLSGLHTETFFAFSAIARDNDAVQRIASWLTPTLAPWHADLVLAPSTAGVALGSALAQQLCVPLALGSLSAAGRVQGVLGDIPLEGRNVLLVNDIFTTGQGLMALGTTVETRGGHVAGAAWFLTRTPVLPGDLPQPHQAIATVPLPSWDASTCEFCAEGQPAELAHDLN